MNAKTVRFNKAIEFYGNSEWGNTIFFDEGDSSYVVIGSVWDSINYIRTYLNKFDKDGNLLSYNAFRESGVSDYYAGSGGALKQLSSGNYINVGGVERFNPFDRDMMFYKFTKKTDTILKKNYDLLNMTVGWASCIH